MKKKPCVLARILTVCCAVLLVAAVAACGLTYQMSRLLTDTALHEGVALDRRVTDAQLVQVENAVNALAAKYSFAPESVMAVVTRESITDYSSQVVGWWMGLLGEEPEMELPVWDTSAVEEAVREDELFREHTPANQRKTIARDNVAYEVGQAVEKAVMPVRVKLLAPFLPMVFERVDVPRCIKYLSLAPAVLAGAAAVLCLMILAAMRRQVSAAMLYIGAGLTGGALLVVLVGALAFALNVTGQVAELSPILAMQLSLLTKQIAAQAGLYVLVCLTVGVALMGLYQAAWKRVHCPQGSAAA